MVEGEVTLFQKYFQATEHRRGRKAIFSHHSICSNWKQKIWQLIYTDGYKHQALETGIKYIIIFYLIWELPRLIIRYIFFYLSYILTETEKVCISVTKKSLAMLCDHCRCSPVPTTSPSALLEAFMSSFESHQRCYKLINRAETDGLLLTHLYIQTKLQFYSVTLVPLACVKWQLQKNTV